MDALCGTWKAVAKKPSWPFDDGPTVLIFDGAGSLICMDQEGETPSSPYVLPYRLEGKALLTEIEPNQELRTQFELLPNGSLALTFEDKVTRYVRTQLL